MAKAISYKYDRWKDPGLAFTDGEVETFNLEAYFQERLEEVWQDLLVWEARSRFQEVTHAWMTKAVRQKLWSWLCDWCLFMQLNVAETFGVAGIEDLDKVQINPKTKEGKALQQTAVNLEPITWVQERLAKAEGRLRYVVSIGNHCIANPLGNPQWNNAKHFNRVIHRLQSQVHVYEELLKQAESFRKKKEASDRGAVAAD